jgi:hypothetical protein
MFLRDPPRVGQSDPRVCWGAIILSKYAVKQSERSYRRQSTANASAELLAEKRAQRVSTRERLSERERKPTVAMDLRSSREAERGRRRSLTLRLSHQLTRDRMEMNARRCQRHRPDRDGMTIATGANAPAFPSFGRRRDRSKIIGTFISLKSGERAL